MQAGCLATEVTPWTLIFPFDISLSMSNFNRSGQMCVFVRVCLCGGFVCLDKRDNKRVEVPWSTQLCHLS